MGQCACIESAVVSLGRETGCSGGADTLWGAGHGHYYVGVEQEFFSRWIAEISLF
jgi:hypothetical protein